MVQEEAIYKTNVYTKIHREQYNCNHTLFQMTTRIVNSSMNVLYSGKSLSEENNKPKKAQIQIWVN